MNADAGMGETGIYLTTGYKYEKVSANHLILSNWKGSGYIEKRLSSPP